MLNKTFSVIFKHCVHDDHSGAMNPTNSGGAGGFFVWNGRVQSGYYYFNWMMHL